ncbi:MAG: hypothetical protein CVT89_07220, partial [Candidatus Altiarchaeales archaeon HGW-Altiarchaeales-2]
GDAINVVNVQGMAGNMTGELVTGTGQVNVSVKQKLIPIIGLTVNKTGPSTVPKGQTVTFTITFTNTGNEPAYNVTINDIAPPGFTNETQSQIYVGTLMPGNSTSVTIKFNTQGASIGNTTNIVKVDANAGNGDNWTFGANKSIEILQPEYVSNMTINATKTLINYRTIEYGYPTVRQLDILNFSINITNTGNATIEKVEIKEFMPSYHTIIGNTSIVIYNLAVNETREVNFYVQVNLDAPKGYYTNVVRAYPWIGAQQGQMQEATTTYYINSTPPILEINITAIYNNSPVNETRYSNDEINLTVHYCNRGGVNSTDTTITIALPPELIYINSSYTNSTGGISEGIYNPATHSVTFDIGTLQYQTCGNLSILTKVNASELKNITTNATINSSNAIEPVSAN